MTVLNLPAGLGDPNAQDVAFSDPSRGVDENDLRQAIASGGLGSYTGLPMPQPMPGLRINAGNPNIGSVLGASTPQPTQAPQSNLPAPLSADQLSTVRPNQLGSKSVNISGLLDKMSKKYNIDPRLMYATIMTESSGHPYSFRAEPQLGTASYGLGQPLYTTAKGLGYTGTPEGLYDPATNLDITAKYLARAIQAGAKTPQQVASYYNSGHLGGQAVPGHVNRFMTNYQSYQPGMEVDINE